MSLTKMAILKNSHIDKLGVYTPYFTNMEV
nr:MAG TPA: hypothetical protein [Caudoviricetes sp.]